VTFRLAIPHELLEEAQNAKPKKLTATPLAQAMDLQHAWNRAQEPNTLKPGDLAQEKEGLGIFNDECPVVIIWRMLDVNDPEDKLIMRAYYRRHACSHVNCIVGRKIEDGSIIFLPHELERLEPYVEKEVTSITAGRAELHKRMPTRKKASKSVSRS